MSYESTKNKIQYLENQVSDQEVTLERKQDKFKRYSITETIKKNLLGIFISTLNETIEEIGNVDLT